MRIKKILVVGTTSDYIDWIRRSCPDRVIFLTEPGIRQAVREGCPANAEELLISLSDHDLVLRTLQDHLDRWEQVLEGIFCFDCEYMELTAFLAGCLNLDYPSVKTIQQCRDKAMSKKLWQQQNISCPRVAQVNDAEDVIAFLKTTPSGCVLKPVAGSGSELVFRCTRPSDCRAAFKTIKKGMKARKSHPLFKKTASMPSMILAEEMIEGTEYSCDFTVEDNCVRIIRLAKKIKSSLKPFGTISGYVLPASLPESVHPERLCQVLLNAAQALGLTRALCMVDFIVSDDQIFLIEMTPRPGGDCLPHLIKCCGGPDILKLSLDFARKRPMANFLDADAPLHVAVRLHANKNGILKAINTHPLMADERVKQILLTKENGHRIVMPPDDYDSWFLGHVIIQPSNQRFPESQAMTISKGIEIVIQPSLQEAS